MVTPSDDATSYGDQAWIAARPIGREVAIYPFV